MAKIIGTFVCFDRKDGKENQSMDVPVEIVDVHQDGLVELGWDDRNERCYLKIKVHQLIEEIMRLAVADEG